MAQKKPRTPDANETWALDRARAIRSARTLGYAERADIEDAAQDALLVKLEKGLAPGDGGLTHGILRNQKLAASRKMRRGATAVARLAAEPEQVAHALEAASSRDKKKKRRRKGEVSSIGKGIANWIDQEAGYLECLFFSGPDGAERCADWLGAAGSGSLQALQSPSGLVKGAIELKIPTDFRPRILAFISDHVQTSGGGWVESAATEVKPRRGRPATQLDWSDRRRDIFRDVARHALRLCGLSGRGLNTLTAPLRTAEIQLIKKAVRAWEAADEAIRLNRPAINGHETNAQAKPRKASQYPAG